LPCLVLRTWSAGHAAWVCAWALFFFFVATLVTGSTCCPIRAMAAPLAGTADASKEAANRIPAAANTTKTVFIEFSEMLRGRKDPPVGEPSEAGAKVDALGAHSLLCVAQQH
jgi:hypothetical protein